MVRSSTGVVLEGRLSDVVPIVLCCGKVLWRSAVEKCCGEVL